jgi:hypothetical protein
MSRAEYWQVLLLMDIKTQKKLLLSALFMLFFVVNVHGKTQRSRPLEGTSGLELKRIKFGCKLKFQNAGIFFIDTRSKKIKDKGKQISRPSFDLFGEYLPDSALGIRLSLGYSGQGGEEKVLLQRDHSLRIYLNYIMLSAILRCYPGSSRQFCLFGGYWGSWLTSAKCQNFVDGQEKGDAVDFLSGPIKRTDHGVLFGLDYELDLGVVVGVYYNLARQRFDDESRSIGYSNYSLGYTLGYNFAKLL